METAERKNYLRIQQLALILTLIASLIAFLISKEINYALGIALGALAALLGFNWIIKMVNGLSSEDAKVQKKVKINYAIRLGAYALIFTGGYYLGLNLIMMLIGYMMMNFAIKIHALLEERGI